VGSAILFGKEKTGWSLAKFRDKPKYWWLKWYLKHCLGKRKEDGAMSSSGMNLNIQEWSGICNTVWEWEIRMEPCQAQEWTWTDRIEVGSAILLGKEKTGWSHVKLRNEPKHTGFKWDLQYCLGMRKQDGGMPSSGINLNILMVEVISAILTGMVKNK
jgi:hypothetical protein